jgi:hypothetical protein
VSITDYAIDILLIAVIFRQVRPRELTPRSALPPLVLTVAVIYLRPSSLGGNDVLLIVVPPAAGIILGIVSGLGDRLWHDERGRLVAPAGAISVVAWVLGMGFRFGFAHYAYHSGATAVANFSRHHDLTGARIWTTALALMAFGQILGRVGILQERRRHATAASGRTPRTSITPETARRSATSRIEVTDG